jgi:hypothetical protein
MSFKNYEIYQNSHTFRDILLGNTIAQLNLKYYAKYKCYTILKGGYPIF